MLDVISLDATEDTPKVEFNSNGVMEISGRSLPEDALGFYEALLEWMREYVKNPNARSELSVQLDYFNSASSKQLIDIMILLEDVHARPEKEVVINWGYEKGDDIMKIRGQEMESIIDLPFKYHEY